MEPTGHFVKLRMALLTNPRSGFTIFVAEAGMVCEKGVGQTIIKQDSLIKAEARRASGKNPNQGWFEFLRSINQGSYTKTANTPRYFIG